MSKKRFITLLTCLTIACAGLGVATACNNGTENSGTESSIVTEYKVKFDSRSGSAVSAQMVKSGEKAMKPEDPTREGWIFIEWQLNSNPYDFDAPVTRDITLTAKWEQKKPEKFSVSFVVEGETEPFRTTEVEEGKKVMEPADIPERAEYLFDGWTLNGEAYDFETPVTEALTLVAKWAKAWTVSFKVGDGTPIKPVLVKEGEGISVPETTQEGYYVSGWLQDGLSYDLETPVTGDITLTAVWEASGLCNNQIGVHAYGWNQTNKADYFNMATDTNGAIIVTAKFSGSTTHYPALVLRELFQKTYYETLIENGETRLVFNLTIGGENAENVDDLYVFGKKLTEFAQKQGVYTITVDLQYILDNYDKVAWIGTKVEAKNAELNYMFLAWKSADWTTRNYVFTISNIAVKPTPELKVDFANGSEDLIQVGKTTTLTAQTNVDEAIEWSSSNPAVATVENGVVTGVKGGEVTITASVDGLTVSKNIYVVGKGVYADQIGTRANGWDKSTDATWLSVSTGNDGEITASVTFQANATYVPMLMLRKIFDKAYYEKLMASGYTTWTFNLAISGTDADKVDDLYIFGKKLTDFTEKDGVYTITVDLQRIITYYATMKDLATLTTAAGQAGSINAMFIAWKSPANDWSTKRSYVFTIINNEFIKTEV